MLAKTIPAPWWSWSPTAVSRTHKAATRKKWMEKMTIERIWTTRKTKRRRREKRLKESHCLWNQLRGFRIHHIKENHQRQLIALAQLLEGQIFEHRLGVLLQPFRRNEIRDERQGLRLAFVPGVFFDRLVNGFLESGAQKGEQA